jgi:hypothetical protein
MVLDGNPPTKRQQDFGLEEASGAKSNRDYSPWEAKSEQFPALEWIFAE